MIRDRRFGPILIIPLALAIGCGRTPSSALTVGGADGGAGRGGAAGSIGGAGGAGGDPTGMAGDGGGIGGTTGGDGAAGTTGAGGAAGSSSGGAAGSSSGAAGTTGAAGAAGSSSSGAAGSSSSGAAGSSSSGAAGSSGGGAAGSSGGGAAGSSSSGAAGSSGGGAAGSSGGGVAGSSGGNASGGSASGGRGGGAAGSGGGAAGSGGGGAAGAAGSGETRLDPTPGSYRLTCDGSMAVMIDAAHFLDGNDEQQGMRLYARGATGTPLATIDVSGGIGLTTGDEADFEDAARIGDRIYVIGSHARNKNGKLERARYRFFAMDLSGTSPAIGLSVPGYTGALLDQMVLAENWTTPDAAVIATLTTSSNLTRATDPTLAPLAGGANIEGLAWLPTTSRPNQLMIGFRTPLQGGKAIVVSLLNADAVIAGVAAQFGEATLLDLGGLSVRGMTWSPVHDAILVIAGPQTDAAGPFRLFKWSGDAADAPIAVGDVTGVPAGSAPESIVAYPNTRDVQVVFDEGDRTIGTGICKDAVEGSQVFGDVIMYVP